MTKSFQKVYFSIRTAIEALEGAIEQVGSRRLFNDVEELWGVHIHPLAKLDGVIGRLTAKSRASELEFLDRSLQRLQKAQTKLVPAGYGMSEWQKVAEKPNESSYWQLATIAISVVIKGLSILKADGPLLADRLAHSLEAAKDFSEKVKREKTKS